MAIVGISPVWVEAQYFDNSGRPLAYGKIYTYTTDVDNDLETYTDSSGSVANTNPIQLDSSGRLTTGIWLRAGEFYGFKLTDVYNNELARVNQVSTPMLTPGDNITLSSPVGPNITISAAGSVGKPMGRGQSYVFAGQNTPGSNVLGDGITFTDIDLTSSTVPIGDTYVEYNGNGVFNFLVSGIYAVDITTSIVATGEDSWPPGESLSGITFSGATPINTTYHSRYRSNGYFGGDNFTQLSFTDTLIVDAMETGERTFGIQVATEVSQSQQFDTTFNIIITKIN